MIPTGFVLVRWLARRGVSLEIHEERLRVAAPKGVLTPDIVEHIRACKPELLDALKTPDMLADNSISYVAIPYAEWKANELEAIFRECGHRGGPGRITAASVAHGMRAARRAAAQRASEQQEVSIP